MDEADILAFCQERMAQAYAEQVWAVALAGAMNGFVIVQREKLPVGTGGLVFWGVAAGSLLALVFLWSRQFIFRHYDGVAKGLIAKENRSILPGRGKWPARAVTLAGWSGTLLYTLIIAGMTWASLCVL